MSGTGKGSLPHGFRRHGLAERRQDVRRAFGLEGLEWDSISQPDQLLDLADVMIESAVGCLPVPIGIADGFLVDGEEIAIPMAVEEPSVIAAASYAARLVRRAARSRH